MKIHEEENISCPGLKNEVVAVLIIKNEVSRKGVRGKWENEILERAAKGGNRKSGGMLRERGLKERVHIQLEG